MCVCVCVCVCVFREREVERESMANLDPGDVSSVNLEGNLNALAD